MPAASWRPKSGRILFLAKKTIRYSVKRSLKYVLVPIRAFNPFQRFEA